MKFCEKCKAYNPDDAKVCVVCGAPLDSAPQQDPAPQVSLQQAEAPGNSQNNERPGSQHIGFTDAIRICMKEKYATFAGRATRAEYWFFYLFCCLYSIPLYIVAIILLFLTESIASYYVVFILGCLPIIIPGISVLVRRLHDIGKSGWWYWLCLIPFVGGIVIFVFTLLPSQKEDNEYGPYCLTYVS